MSPFRIQATDPRALPAYPFADASRYLRLPKATLASWARGRRGRTGSTHPLLMLPGSASDLSFLNLVEAHVLIALRKVHRIKMGKVRRAVELMRKRYHTDHPLALDLETDGVDVFLQESGVLVNLSQHGQLAIRVVLQALLKRIVYGPDGVAAKLSLLPRGVTRLEVPARIVVDPLVAYGRPAILGTGVPTEIIAQRFRAGDSVQALSDDYDIAVADIEEALRCEGAEAQAA